MIFKLGKNTRRWAAAWLSRFARLNFSYCDSGGESMESDPTRMRHVFVNLLGDLKLELSFFTIEDLNIHVLS